MNVLEHTLQVQSFRLGVVVAVRLDFEAGIAENREMVAPCGVGNIHSWGTGKALQECTGQAEGACTAQTLHPARLLRVPGERVSADRNAAAVGPVVDLIGRGEVAGIKIGRNWVTTEEAVREYLSKDRRPGPKTDT